MTARTYAAPNRPFVAATMRAALGIRGVSPRQIAERLGVPLSTINDWLSDSRTPAKTGHPEALPAQAPYK